MRALREIHLKPFKITVKEGQASTIITSYNVINGHRAASNYYINTTIFLCLHSPLSSGVVITLTFNGAG